MRRSKEERNYLRPAIQDACDFRDVFENSTKEREDFVIELGYSFRSAHDYCRSMNYNGVRHRSNFPDSWLANGVRITTGLGRIPLKAMS